MIRLATCNIVFIMFCFTIGTYQMRRHFKAAMEKGAAKTSIAKVCSSSKHEAVQYTRPGNLIFEAFG